jgi:FkbM family methyltransferase
VVAKRGRLGHVARIHDARAPVTTEQISVARPSRKGFPILRRFSYSVHRRFLRYFRNRFVVDRKMGVLMLMDQLNLVDRTLLIRGIWEGEQISYLKSLVSQFAHLSTRRVFVDIGAHSGLYALQFAKEFEFTTVVAFEPLPANLAQLRANLFMNGLLDRVTVVEKALGDRVGLAAFVSAPDKNRGVARLSNGVEHPLEKTLDVEITRLDRYLDLDGALIVAKIDVEGGELDVIAGMDGLFDRGNSFILQIECNENQSAELTDTLTRRGFTFLRAIEEDHYFVNFKI